MKPRLLVLELWGIGDLAIATPFLQAAAEKFEVSLLAKPFAKELGPRFWPAVEVFPFTAPWTAFALRSKYALWSWPWRDMLRLRRELRAKHFDYAVCARWDPRNHFILESVGARERLGFSRLKSQRYLTQDLTRPHPLAHRSEYWRTAGKALGLNLPTRENLVPTTHSGSPVVLLHSGARLPARIWPLTHFQQLARRLRENNFSVQIACDPDQLVWWQQQGERASAPRTITELLGLVDRAGIFVGNCSGPGHLAAIAGVPTFTLFGPSMHEWFLPMHPAAELFEGRPCPYKPCSDYCRYAKPFCLGELTADDVWPKLETFAKKHLPAPLPTAS